ncbi:MAG: tRNA lysidine(34) synthetase TilS [Methylophilaceae bacterium]|nr:tRNA lysidine(34) synthetase TilS [Methylophilaceae bacterium]
MSKLIQKNKLQSNRLESKLQQFLVQIFAHQKTQRQALLLAYSGGLDSTVLLHLLVNLRHTLNFDLDAEHIHHGLSGNADNWAEFCLLTCSTLNIPLKTTYVKIAANNDLGIEAAARQLRYDALFESNADYICLAHHEDDQAETLLLQLARGAGVKGLSAMAATDVQRRLLRPLLNISRVDLLEYAQQNNLTWIEDESNQDTKFDRNFIRHSIMPVLNTRYPAIAKTLARSAAHIAEAANLLDDLAVIDAQGVVKSDALSIAGLQAVSANRARNLLRWWITRTYQAMRIKLEVCTSMPINLVPSAELLGQIFSQLAYAKTDAKIEIILASTAQNIFSIRRYQGMAYLINMPNLEPQDYHILWQGESILTLPDNTQLNFLQQLDMGLALKRLDIQKLRISYRKGGERFRPNYNRPTRTLKHLLQETNLPPWQREWLPLIYVDEKLVFVPGLGVDIAMQAHHGEVGYVIKWLRN